MRALYGVIVRPFGRDVKVWVEDIEDARVIEGMRTLLVIGGGMEIVTC